MNGKPASGWEPDLIQKIGYLGLILAILNFLIPIFWTLLTSSQHLENVLNWGRGACFLAIVFASVSDIVIGKCIASFSHQFFAQEEPDKTE